MAAMFAATILFSGRGWLLPAAVAVLVAGGLLWWTYRASPNAPRGVRAACVFLKLLGLLALAACLLEPLWSRERAKPGANYLVLLADNSQSMQVKGRGQPDSQGERFRKLLTAEKSPWQEVLLENFQLRRYRFDGRVQSEKDFTELNLDGSTSSLLTALRTIAERFRGQPLAGILLFTDGNATDLGDTLPDLTGLPPLYPVLGESGGPVRDLAVQKVAVSQTTFEDAPVTVQAEIASPGFDGEKLVVQLVEVANVMTTVPATSAVARTNRTAAIARDSGPGTPTNAAKPTVIAEQILRVPEDNTPLAARFQVRPSKAGITYYRLRVAEKGEAVHLDNGKPLDEATLANNTRVIAVDRGRGPHRILYVAGRPNWEFKFLNRAVAEDDQMDMVSLIRIARREPKFEFRGRAGESSNPLFRGFENQSKEEVERYDKPVLVRLNTRDQYELSGGFPKEPEELYAFKAIVIDDLEAGFFTPDQMALIKRYVSERGGGLLMLGGAESFAQGEYPHTPIGELLPVYLDGVRQYREPGELKLALTREGWLEPWARLRNTESDEAARLEAMPGFQVANEVRGLKPGASAVATTKDSNGLQQPAIAVQRYGNGRVGAVMIGDLWRWGLRDETLHRDMDKAWRQLVRWLVADVPNQVHLAVEPKRGDPNNAVSLQVRARDKKFQPLDNAAVTVLVRFAGQPSGAATNAAAIRLTAEPSLSEAGLYTTTFIPRDTGGYFAEASVTDSSGVDVGSAQAGWSSDPAADEFRNLQPNGTLLETIAQKTGGAIILPDKLEEWARELPNKKLPVTEVWTTPLWHQTGVFLLALLCFVAEWGLRRWKGMV
jgi:uncharacterized membrane protein